MALPLVCPAASEVTSSSGAPSVKCGVLALSNEGASIDGWEGRAQVEPVFDGHTDAHTVRYFCCHDGSEGDPRAGYTNCVIWQAEADATDAGRKGPDALRDEQATRVDAPPDPRVAGALDVLEGGSFSESGAIERAMQAGGVVLGE